MRVKILLIRFYVRKCIDLGSIYDLVKNVVLWMLDSCAQNVICYVTLYDRRQFVARVFDSTVLMCINCGSYVFGQHVSDFTVTGIRLRE